jgi:antibiotic biosynthesis monooxygenase (ABM) superfamily enzyme
MQDMTGKLSAQMSPKHKMKLIMLLGNQIMMLMGTLARNALPNLFSLFTRTGLKRLISMKKLKAKLRREISKI